MKWTAELFLRCDREARSKGISVVDFLRQHHARLNDDYYPDQWSAALNTEVVFDHPMYESMFRLRYGSPE